MGIPGFDTPAYGNLGGALPWGGGGNPAAAAASGNPAAIAATYSQSYNSALAMNQSNYNNILAGYQQTMARQTSAQQAISAGYSDLYNSVLSKVSDIGAARSGAIDRESAAALGKGSQQLIDRGLGNTTIQSSLNRGVEADRSNRQLELSDSMARMVGDYMSNLGGQGLANAERGMRDSTGLSLNQLHWMDSVNSRYPDGGMYAGLARDAAMAGKGGGGAGSFGGGSFGGGAANPAQKIGYVPGPGPYYGGGGSGSPGGGGGGPSWLMSQYAQAAPNAPSWTNPGEGAMIAGGTDAGGAMAGIFGGGGGGQSVYAPEDYGGGGDF